MYYCSSMCKVCLEDVTDQGTYCLQCEDMGTLFVLLTTCRTDDNCLFIVYRDQQENIYFRLCRWKSHNISADLSSLWSGLFQMVLHQT